MNKSSGNFLIVMMGVYFAVFGFAAVVLLLLKVVFG